MSSSSAPDAVLASPTADPRPATRRRQRLHAVDLSLRHNLRFDVPAGLVVFLVALPLCLGIALASGAPLVSGLVAGIVGGLVVPLLSRSELSVSGPAAGLAAIVATGLHSLGRFELFCGAVVIAGVLQILLGLVRGGVVTAFIPSAVIRGMLAAIGILLILKQLPVAVGYGAPMEDTTAYVVTSSTSAFAELRAAIPFVDPGSLAVSLVSLAVLVLFERSERLRSMTWLPGALVVVLVGTAINEAFRRYLPELALAPSRLVSVPTEGGFPTLLASTPKLDPRAFMDTRVYAMGFTLAIVASLETLLSIDAIDKLDPYQRRSDPDRELLAQGIANSLSGLLGGLPITSVIVRSSANLNSGGRTRVAAFVHGLLLLVAVVFAGRWLNHIPLPALASILLVTGYKLAKPRLFRTMYELGHRQFFPFAVTVIAIVVTDLLRGIAIGIVLGIAYILRDSLRGAFEVLDEGDGVKRIRFLKDIHFFHKASVIEALEELTEGTLVFVDRGLADYVEHDVVEAICEFREAADTHGVQLELAGIEPVRTVGSH